MSETHSLFAYGTLRDPEIQQILFGEIILSSPAMLPDHDLATTDDGYLFLRIANGSTVRGEILQLTTPQLLIADQFEELPFYVRESRSFLRDGGDLVTAWVYLRPGDTGPLREGEAISTLPRSELLDIVRGFRSQIDAIAAAGIPFCDLYLFVPCRFEIPRWPEPDPEFDAGTKTYLAALTRTAESEFSSTLFRELKRVRLADVEVVAETDGAHAEIARQRAQMFLTWHEQTGLAVLSIPLPAVSLPALPLLDQLSRDELLLDEPGGRRERYPVSRWLDSLGLIPVGRPKAALFLAERPHDDNVLPALLASESSASPICGRRFCAASEQNLAQYSSAMIYGSETCLVEIPVHFQLRYEDRLAGQILTTFIVEVLLFQEAALTRASEHVASELQDHGAFAVRDALRTIEELGREFSEAMRFWNVRNFRYRTAQALADEVGRVFGIERMMENYRQSQAVLENLISIHSARITEVDNRSLNNLIVVLTAVGILPTLFSVLHWSFDDFALDENLYAGLLAVAACGVVVVAFVIVKQCMRERALVHRPRVKGAKSPK